MPSSWAFVVLKVFIMRSFFWRIFASFWLAIIVVAISSMLVGRALNQDAWILNQHPAVQKLAEQWVSYYEQGDLSSAEKLIKERHNKHRIDIQILTDSGTTLFNNFSRHKRRAMSPMQGNNSDFSHGSQWRQISQEYTSPQTDQSYLFIYRIPRVELSIWQRDSLWRPISGIIITLIVLTIFSILLTLSITRPLKKLRGAVNDLGRTAYQKNSLANLANRKDEFGLLAKDFSLMGEHLQTLINSQRQLLRDVSHELRSPLARLKITLALLERAKEEDNEKLSARLSLECDRLEALISEILTLARLDSLPSNKTPIELASLFKELQDDLKISAPEQKITVSMPDNMIINGWVDQLERALDNLIRNAVRFNPNNKPIEIKVWQQDHKTHITVRDHGVGVSKEHLTELGKPFFRAPNQTAQGYGLGLAISKRVLENHQGQLLLNNHPEGGFMAELILPIN